jgi:hypothetical protein
MRSGPGGSVALMRLLIFMLIGPLSYARHGCDGDRQAMASQVQ